MTAPRTTYLACYDIAESPRRLARVRRVLMDAAVPIQYSVFLATLTPAQRAGLLRRLACTIDPRRDDIRLYPIPTAPHFELLGRPVLPAGILAGTPGIVPKQRG